MPTLRGRPQATSSTARPVMVQISTRPPWSRWWVPAACAAVTLPLIIVLGPEYGHLQRAADAEAARSIVGHDRGRYVLAVIADVLFATSYGLTAFAITNRTGLPRWAPALVVLGAILDQLENVFVLANVLWVDSIGDATVDIMRTIGTVKIWALVAGVVGMIGGVAVLLHRRKYSINVPDEAQNRLAMAGWFTLFVVMLAAFAGAVRFEAPLLAIVVLGLVCVYALGCLSTADRRATDAEPEGRMACYFFLAAVGTGTVFVASVVADEVPDEWGFAALGAALYAFIRSIDHARRALSGHGRLRLGLLITALVGYAATWLPVDNLRMVGAASAIVAGAAVVELWSASFPPVLVANRVPAAVIGGALILAITVGMLFFNEDPVITSVAVAAVGVITALLVTGNDAPILLGVLLLAALWSGVPRDVSFPQGQEPQKGEPYFAVLGDSYISGEGTDSYFKGSNTTDEEASWGRFPADRRHGNECRQSPAAWPMLLNAPQTHDSGDVLGLPGRVANLACSGAVTADIRQVTTDKRGEPEQLADLRQAIAEFGPPVFVVVGIGGNDAQFADIGAACILPGDCDEFLEEVRARQVEAVGHEVARTHAEIRILLDAVGVNVPVIAVPYPKPIYMGDGCPGVVLSAKDIGAINNYAAALNKEIFNATKATGALYMDTMEDGLADSAAQLCEPNGPSGLNFADLNPKGGSLWAALYPRNWGHNFVHPNEGGHAALRAAALRWFEKNDCVLERSCDSKPLSDVRQLAEEQVDPPADVKHDAAAAFAVVAPIGVGVLGLLTVAWWLLITAWSGWSGALGSRPVSPIERIARLTSPGDDSGLGAAPPVPPHQPTM